MIFSGLTILYFNQTQFSLIITILSVFLLIVSYLIKDKREPIAINLTRLSMLLGIIALLH